MKKRQRRGRGEITNDSFKLEGIITNAYAEIAIVTPEIAIVYSEIVNAIAEIAIDYSKIAIEPVAA